MYSVSDAYKIAVADSHRKSKMRAEIKIGSNIIPINDSDIIKDTVYVTNQCTNGNEFEYGCVYAAECGLTIKSAVDRYSLYGAELKLFWSLWTGETWEEIPLGVFYITEPNRINDKISIKALDGMTKLDPYVSENTQGTIPQLMSYIAEKCGVELAQTEEELSALINGEIQLSVEEGKVDCYRDLLAYICMVSASFAVFDRFGKLKIVQYATEPCVTLGKNHRFTNATFSDYTTSFVGVKARFIAEENYATYTETIEEEIEGLILDMGDIPIVRGLPETKQEVLKAVLDVLKEVKYTPFSIETLGNPAIDLGDYVKNTSVGREGKTYYSPVTYYYWQYRGKHKLRAVGGNPKLAGMTSLRDKYTKSLEGMIETKQVVVRSYSNADEITFTGTEKEIAVFNYATAEDSKPILLLTIRVKTSLDGVLKIQFYNNALVDKNRVYRQYLERGEHIVSLAEAYTIKANTRSTITVSACMEFFESDARKQAADIATQNNFLAAIAESAPTVADNVVVFPTYEKGVIDTTVPTATIASGGVNAILYGQGLAGEGKWDGTIKFVEDIGKLIFTNPKFANIDYTAKTALQTPKPVIFAESFGSHRFGGLTMYGLSDSVSAGRVINDYTFSTLYADKYDFDKYVIDENGMFELKTEYLFESTEQPIDSGKMCSVVIETEGIAVESVVVENG